MPVALIPCLRSFGSHVCAGTEKSMSSLIQSAQKGDQRSIGELLQEYRQYLTVLAATQLEQRLRPRVSPSDVVQETMLRAHKNFGQFRGTSEPQLLAWLRQILVNNLANFVEQHMLAARRDVRREVSIDQMRTSLEESSVQLAALIPCNCNSPSSMVERREEAVELANRLSQLPPDYRKVLVLRNLQGQSFEKVAQQTNRSEGAARMLWLRAIERLRSDYRRMKHREF